MTLTIGIPCYKNRDQVWFTLQALRLYHDLTGVELLVVDNFGDDSLRDLIEGWMGDTVRYTRWLEVPGPAGAKNQVFAEARGEWVMVMDSHVLLAPGAVSRLTAWCAGNISRDLYHGPLVYDDLRTTADAMNDEWRGQMWGTWRQASVSPDAAPYEIPLHGCGLLLCRRDAWLGFNPEFRGFGGEEGYIHTKYRQAGQQVMLLPWLRWHHYFQTFGGSVQVPYTPLLSDKIRNYLLGCAELGLDPQRVIDHFGAETVRAHGLL